MTTKKKATHNGQEPRQGVTTTVFLPEAMQQRLARYVYEKHAGRSHMRNKILLEALDAKLAKEGY